MPRDFLSRRGFPRSFLCAESFGAVHGNLARRGKRGTIGGGDELGARFVGEGGVLEWFPAIVTKVVTKGVAGAQTSNTFFTLCDRTDPRCGFCSECLQNPTGREEGQYECCAVTRVPYAWVTKWKLASRGERSGFLLFVR